MTKRTPLQNRPLPDYTRGEELTNTLTHACGAVLGLVVLVLCLLQSRTLAQVAGSLVYGITMTALYVISSVYHGMRPSTAKKVMQVVDHCAIYFLIAGTYTPIMLCSLRPVHPAWAWSLLGVVWGIAALAITLNAIDLKKFAVFSMICYIGMGWCVIAGIKPVLEVLPSGALWLLVLGGVVYTLGAVAYGLGKKKRYMHSLFHICCLGGSVLQALCIIFYVL